MSAPGSLITPAQAAELDDTARQQPGVQTLVAQVQLTGGKPVNAISAGQPASVSLVEQLISEPYDNTGTTPSGAIGRVRFPVFNYNGFIGAGLLIEQLASQSVHFHVVGKDAGLGASRAQVDARNETCDIAAQAPDSSRAYLTSDGSGQSAGVSNQLNGVGAFHLDPGATEGYVTLSSANGLLWRLSISNAGALVIAPV